MGWESSDVVRFGLRPNGSLALVSCLSGGYNSVLQCARSSFVCSA